MTNTTRTPDETPQSWQAQALATLYPEHALVCKKCGSLCMGAKGPSCDCSCGGENHGASS